MTICLRWTFALPSTSLTWLKKKQVLSRFSVLQATKSWAGCAKRGYCTRTIQIVNLSLIRSERISSRYSRSGKKDKQVKQYDNVTSSQSEEGLHHLNTSKMFNSVHTTIYYTLVMFRVNERKEIRRAGNVASMWRTASLNLACLPMSGNVRQCVHVPF